MVQKIELNLLKTLGLKKFLIRNMVEMQKNGLMEHGIREKVQIMVENWLKEQMLLILLKGQQKGLEQLLFLLQQLQLV